MVSILLPTCLGAILFRHLPKSLKILAVFIFIVALLEVITYIMSAMSMNNMLLFHAYSFVEFGCISLIYYTILNSVKTRRFVLTVLTLFVVLSSANIIYFESIESFNSYQRFMEFVFIILYLFLYMSELIKSEDSPFLEMHPYFILSISFLVYFTGTFILFIYAKNISKSQTISPWTIHAALNIFLNLMYSVVIWKGSKALRSL